MSYVVDSSIEVLLSTLDLDIRLIPFSSKGLLVVHWYDEAAQVEAKNG